MAVVCKNCGETYALAYRNDMYFYDGTIENCKGCKNEKN